MQVNILEKHEPWTMSEFYYMLCGEENVPEMENE